MRKLYFILFLCCLFLTSCDPSQGILFTNKSESNVKVKLIINSSVKNEQLDKMKKGDSIVFNLVPHNPDEKGGHIYFGRGRWNDQEITKVSKSIKSIEIENDNYRIIYKSQKAIRNLLKDNYKGIIMKSLNIKIQDDLKN
jgi:ASC-1-like (ASCH) protein